MKQSRKKPIKITFLSLNDAVDIPSLRFLSAYVKSKGHVAKIIMLPRIYAEGLDQDIAFRYPYSDAVLEQIRKLCRDSDIVGLSLMTCHFDNSIQLTRYLHKELRCPVIWGGAHPTIRPLECLEYADMVCIGEAEVNLTMLLDEMSKGASWKKLSIPGIIHDGAKEVRPGPLLEDLSELPLPDYDFKDHYLLYEKSKIIPVTKSLLIRCLYNTYRTTFARGCPYSCSYCCNNAFNHVYGRKLPIRQRPISHIIQELERAKKLFPEMREVDITDDTFMAQSLERIQEFSREYKLHIGLPFKVLTTPVTFTKEKVLALLDAGLCATGVGIQSASIRTRSEIFKRFDKLEQVLAVGDVMRQIQKETGKTVFVRYDLIVDNPWERDEDLEETIRFILKLKRPVELMMFSLTFYPGTDLYERACKEGFVTDDLNQIYRKSQLAPARTYLNGLCQLAGMGMSVPLVKFFLSRKLPRKHMVGVIYLLIRLYLFRNAVRSVIVKGILKWNFKWVGHLFLFSMDVAKGVFKSASTSHRKRFEGPAGEV